MPRAPRSWIAIGLPALLLSAYCTPDPDPSASTADAGAPTGAGGYGRSRAFGCTAASLPIDLPA